MAATMKNTKISQKTTLAIPAEAEAPGRTASTWRLALDSRSLRSTPTFSSSLPTTVATTLATM